MRLLITGAGGQVGRELVEFSRARGDEVTALTHDDVDVRVMNDVDAAVMNAHPDVVVHAGAWTAVDACEQDPDRAHAVNVVGTANVAAAARKVSAFLIYLSTDYVFDGTKATPYVETDTPNPASVYGKSKLGGEQEVGVSDDAAVLRISWVCGRYGANMVKTLLKLAADGVNPKFVDDQIGHPTIVADLVPMLHRFATERRPGLYHVTNQGAVSWYEFAREVFSAASADPDRISPIATADLDPPRPAPRPANSVLDNAALRAAGVPLLPDHRESLVQLVRQLTT